MKFKNVYVGEYSKIVTNVKEMWQEIRNFIVLGYGVPKTSRDNNV